MYTNEIDDNAATLRDSHCEQFKDRAYEKVVKFVKENIQNGNLKVGDKLSTERELSERLELSRNSVREALRTLDNMGLISSRQGSGNYLTGDLSKNIEESFAMMFMLRQIDDIEMSQLRRAVDIQAMRLAVRNITDDEIEELRHIFDKYMSAESNNAVFLDKEFHFLIAKYSKNGLFMTINSALSEVMDKFIFKARSLVIQNEGDVITVMHTEMMRSLLERNEEKGILAVNTHYDIIDRYL
ncbi:MAG: GntR family transcriptional regulator [Candidatus Metalachnospira sp.]|nr:GntR family transcriptional regulator [Candidatus Metalachnospira sp.]